jgi:PQQ-dependent catabolism-associated CXXCW motif protein
MTARVSALITLAFVALAAGAPRAEDGGIVEPQGYRTDNYRAPTPKSLTGARVVIIREAEELWTSRAAIFVDVMPRPPRPAGLPSGTIWRDKPRLNIPGSVWLPDTGYGELAPATADYFRDGLRRATADDPTRTLLFYCLKDCWMSWNAAKRAISLGYINVVWYPDGTDRWEGAGLPLEDAKPVARVDK